MNDLFALGNVSTLVIAICSIIGIVGALVGACLHFRIPKLPKTVKEVSILGSALVIKQFTPPNSKKEISIQTCKEDNILPQVLDRKEEV